MCMCALKSIRPDTEDMTERDYKFPFLTTCSYDCIVLPAVYGRGNDAPTASIKHPQIEGPPLTV